MRSRSIVNATGDLLRGRFSGRHQLLAWIGFGYLIALLLALRSATLVPENNDFAVFRTCVSNLGSPDADCNPSGYLWFCVALVLIAVTLVPLILFRHRAMVRAFGDIRRIGILTGLYLGGMGMWIVAAAFPMSDRRLIGGLTFDDVHNNAGKIAFLACGFGICLDGLGLLIRHAYPHPGQRSDVEYRRLLWPYAIGTLVCACAVIFILSWQLRRAADPTLRWTGDGIHAFALWEWLMTLTAPTVLAWVALVWMRTMQGAGASGHAGPRGSRRPVRPGR